MSAMIRPEALFCLGQNDRGRKKGTDVATQKRHLEDTAIRPTPNSGWNMQPRWKQTEKVDL